MSENKSVGGIAAWMRNRRLRTKIYMIIAIITILMLVSIAVSISTLIAENQEIDTLITQDLAFEEEFLQLDIVGNEMIIFALEYIIEPSGEGATDADWVELKSNFNEHKANVLDLADVMQISGNIDLVQDITDIIHEIDNVIVLTEGNTSSSGLFEAVDSEKEVLDEFELEVEKMVEDLDLFEEQAFIAGDISGPTFETLEDLVKEYEVLALEGEAFVLHYALQFDTEDKHIAEYIYDIKESNEIDGTDVSKYRQLTTVLDEMRTEVSANATLTAMLDDTTGVGSEYTIAKNEVIETFEFADGIERDALVLSDIAHEIEIKSDALINRISSSIDEDKVELDLQFQQSLITTVSLAIGAVFLSLIVGAFIARQTIKPVNELQKDVQAMATGDLTKDFGSNQIFGDEIGELTENFTKMYVELQDLVRAIVINSNNLTSSSEELASAAEETNAATEEVSSTSQSMSQAASQQAEMIAVSVEEITKINEVVTEITESIQHNSDIISQIALQTNILALNAGIEASRAGDYGRGFAVVAENVRRLSEESKNAAEEITSVAGSISETLRHAFDTIKIQIEEVAALSEETAASAEEVAAAAEEVTSSMEEVSASSQDLSEQAIEALDRVSIFKIK